MTRPNRVWRVVAASLAVSVLAGCGGNGDALSDGADNSADSTVEVAESAEPSPAADSAAQESEAIRQAPDSCDFELLRNIGWRVLEPTENLDPTRFHSLLSRPDPLGDVPEGLRCVYGGESYHDILVIEYQPIGADGALEHQALLASQSYQQAEMSTVDTPIFFRALVTLDEDSERLPGDIPGFNSELCWDMFNYCVSEVVMYGPGSWAAVGWSGAAWGGEGESSLLATVRDILLEGW
jgi:hypothetical protein